MSKQNKSQLARSKVSFKGVSVLLICIGLPLLVYAVATQLAPNLNLDLASRILAWLWYLETVVIIFIWIKIGKGSLSDEGRVRMKGVLLLLAWFAPVVFYVLFPQGVPELSQGFFVWFLWSILIAILWISFGDGSSAHRTIFAPYKSIWISFVLLFSLLFAITFFVYQDVQQRVSAIRSLSVLEKVIGIRDAADASQPDAGFDLQPWLVRGRKALDHILLCQAPPPLEEWKCKAPPYTTIDTDLQNLRAYAGSIRLVAQRIDDLTQQLATSVTLTQQIDFDLLEIITNEIGVTADQTITATAALPATWLNTRKDEFQLQIKNLINYYIQLQASIEAARSLISAGAPSVLAPFILIAGFFGVFLLLPWLFLLLFLQKRRGAKLKEKSQVLRNLGVEYKEYKERFPIAQQKAAEDRAELRNGGKTGDEDLNLEELIGGQAFYNREYVSSLIILTTMSALLWLSLFYPTAGAGLARLISEGKGAKGFAEFIGINATPLTVGFVGAYFFVLQMLMHRYFSDDLNPPAYISAFVRVGTTFLLCLPLLLFTQESGQLSGGALVLVLAFIIGIYPRVALKVFWEKITGWIPKVLKLPPDLESDDLTVLDGLNPYHEARLREIKIETIQNLATAPLDDLIVDTNFAPDQIFDWVDQAILYLYAGKLWRDAFRNVGIRTATGLLNNTCMPDAEKYDYNKEEAEKLVKAINAAHASSATTAEAKNGEKSSNPTDITEELLHAIVKSMQACPNTDKLWRFWEESKEAKQAVESAQSVSKTLIRR